VKERAKWHFAVSQGYQLKDCLLLRTFLFRPKKHHH
jgi:hypothetical protein